MSEPIELKIDARWKWAAKDGDGGGHFAYLEKPVFHGRRWSESRGHDYCTYSSLNIFDIDLGEPADSLHQIIGGKLVKYVDVPADGERVIVWHDDSKKLRRYSAGGLDHDRWLTCYSDGMDKWSSRGETTQWKNWRRPTPEELEES